MKDPNQPTDSEHEAAFIAAIQDGATLDEIDHFIAVHQEQVAHEQQVIDENR